MNNKKNILMYVVLVIVSLILMSMTVVASEIDSGRCGENLRWSYDENGTLTFSGTGEMDEYPLFIKEIVLSDGSLSAVALCSNFSEWREVTLSDGTAARIVFQDERNENAWKEVTLSDGSIAIVDCSFPWKELTLSDGTAFVVNGLSYKDWKEVTLSDGSISIIDADYDAFEIILSDGTCFVTSIAPWSDLIVTKVVISDTVSDISEGALVSFKDAVEFEVSSDNAYFYVDGGVLYNKNEDTLMKFPAKSAVQEYSVKDSVNKIEMNAFWGCSNIEKVIIPDTVTEIKRSTFVDCQSLKSIVLPEKLERINKSAFSGCTNLTSIDITDTITEIETDTFYGCTALKSIVFPKNLKWIGENAFYGCAKLESIVFPETLEFIGKNAFSNCKSLSFIDIPNCITKIEPYTFANCSALNNVELPEKLEIIDEYAFWNCKELSEISISCNVNAINRYAFANCMSLKRVELPDKMDTVDVGVFEGCSSLCEVIFPNSMKNVGYSAFANCVSLKSIELPEKVENIRKNAFSGCASLERIVLPKSVKRISGDSFSGTAWEKSVSGQQGVIYLDHVAYGYIPGDNDIGKIEIKDGTTVVASRVFDYEKIESVSFPDSIEFIGEYAFYNCKYLSEINIPCTVSGIGTQAFHGTLWYEMQPFGMVYIRDTFYYIKQDRYMFIDCVEIDKGTHSIADGALGYSNCFIIPNTVINFGEQVLDDNDTIKSYNDTYAEKYAIENGAKFESLGDVPEEELIFDIDNDKTITANDVVENVKSVAFAEEGNLTSLKKLNELLKYIRSLAE